METSRFCNAIHRKKPCQDVVKVLTGGCSCMWILRKRLYRASVKAFWLYGTVRYAVRNGIFRPTEKPVSESG